MKINILTALLLAASISAGAQTKEKKSSLSDTTQVVYATTDGQIKDGAYYIKNIKNDHVLVQGNYKNDARVGSWYFFSGDNKLKIRYNYDQKKLAYLDNSMFANADVTIPDASEEVAKNTSAPVPLCAVDYYTALVTSKVYNFNRSGSQNIAVTAHVETDGSATYYLAYMDGNKKTSEKELKIKEDKFAIDWIPAMYKGKPVYSEFTVYSTITADVSAQRRTRWND